MTEYFSKLALSLWQARDLWLRALACWGIGLAFVWLDKSSINFDRRFQIRGPQSPAAELVLVLVSRSEWAEIHRAGREFLRPLPFRELGLSSDNFYWNPSTWADLLERILEDKPLGIGVTLFFDPQTLASPEPLPKIEVLMDERVFWAAEIDSEGRARLPALTGSLASNTGIAELRADEDRVVRSFSSGLVQIPHLALRLAQSSLSRASLSQVITGESYLINFQAPPGHIPQVKMRDLWSGQIAPGFFHNKIVLMGSSDKDNHSFPTPLGDMSRAEIIAQITDNIIGDKWIQPAHPYIIAIYLLVLMLVSVFIMTSYPQSVAFVFLFWLGTGVGAVSLWTFDSFYFWLPIQAPLVQLIATYIIFLGHQLTVKENLSWKLEQEKKYLFEVEQIKSNFISLISHDLKNPLAKIQAICDRLLTKPVEPEVEDGLKALRNESVELHRYIQSILQISRVESGAFRLNKEAFDINDVVNHCVRQLEPLAQAKNIQFEISLEPLFSIEADAVLIQEVVLNLLENAIKYTPEGGKIHISSLEVDNEVLVTVEDTGPGVAPEEQDKIFEKFYRGRDQVLATKGTGLGLFLVKYFVELHRGRIIFSSEVGKGTRMGFSLPIHGSENTQRPEELEVKTSEELG